MYPTNFVWGTSTSAHQVEGNNHNDWSEWELQNAERLAKEAPEKYADLVYDWESIKDQATNPANYISGQASDHYNRYAEDIETMESLGIKAYRFSIEWSRIEPKEGQWNETAIEHYKEVVRALKASGIEPFITLWHRTNPLWIRDIDDWQNKNTVNFYLRYVEKMLEIFKDDVRFWMPLNEPIMSLAGGYLGGIYPPNKKNPLRALKVFRNFALAHNGAYAIIHKYRPDAQVGIPHAAVYADPHLNKWRNRVVVKLLNYLANHRFLNAIEDHVDFIGVQYYHRGVIHLTLNKYLLPSVEVIRQSGPKSDMGWEIYPQGMYNVIIDLATKYRKPIYVTENGVTDAKDRIRAEYIVGHLKAIHRAIAEGVDVRGYFYWSLLDNLEWDKGFWPRFGLVEVNYVTKERKVRPSALKYAAIIKNNGIDEV